MKYKETIYTFMYSHYLFLIPLKVGCDVAKVAD